MAPIRTLIVENNEQDIKSLQTLIKRGQRFLNLSVMSIARNFDDAIDILRSADSFQLSILDIDLPCSRDCFEIIELIERKKFGIITLHSIHEKYFKNVKLEVIQKMGDHLTLPKPYADQRFVDYSYQVKERLPQLFPQLFPNTNSLGLYSIEEIGQPERFLDNNDIYFVEADNNKSKFHIMTRYRHYAVFQSPLGLDEAEKILDKNVFFRCHRSYLVNTANITSHTPGKNSGELFFSNGRELNENRDTHPKTSVFPQARYSNANFEELLHYIKKNHGLSFSP